MVTALASTPVTVGSLSMRADTAALRKVTATLARIADHRSSLPMLAHVRLKASDLGTVSLSVTDLNLSATYTDAGWFPASGSTDLCIPAKQLASIVKTAAGSEVTISVTGNHGLRVASGDAEMTLIGRSGQDFPKLPDSMADDLRMVPVAGAMLGELIERVLPSVCLDETRFHLNGILIECDERNVRMVSTDGHRLTRSDARLNGPRITAAILPSKAAKEIAKIIASGDATWWGVTKSHLFVRCGGWTVAAKLIDATFPAYDQVIPKSYEKCASVERKTLIAALRRALKVTSKTRGVKLTFASGKLTLTSDHPDTGTAVETMAAGSQWLDEGGSCDIGVNPSYLIDALDGIEDRCVTIDMCGELDPMLVRGTTHAVEYSVEVTPHLVVVMPMRI